MSGSPFNLPQLPIPNLPFFTSPISQATPPPFSTNQQNILTAFANGINNVSPTLLTSGAQDLFNAEQTLQGSGLTLNGLIQQLLSIPSFLTPATQASITSIIGVLNAPNLATLSTLLLNPQNYLTPIVVSGIGNNGAITTGILVATGKSGPGSSPITPTQVQQQSVALSTNIPLNIAGRVGPGVISSSGIGGLNTGSTVSGVSSQTFYVPISAPLATTFQAFIDALVGQTPGTNDFFSVLQSLYNWALPNANNLQNFSTLISAFNQGNLLGNSFNPATVPYRFPALNGDTFANLVTEVLTFVTQPGQVVAEILLTPAGTLSFSQNAYNFLNAQPGGSSGTSAQGFLAPLINVLFGSAPSNVTPTSPFNTLFNLVTNGPVSWLTGLFPSATISGSSPALSVQQFISDALKNPNNIPSDIAAILKPIVPNILISAFPTTLVTGGSSPQQLLIDLLGPVAGGKITNVPFDVLNLVPMSLFAGPTNSNSSSIGLGTYLQGLITNFNNFATNLFVGQHPTSNFIGFNDSVQFGNIPSGQTAGASASGWGSSVTPPNFPSGLNGALQGDLGAIFMLSAAAAGDFTNAINSVVSSAGAFLTFNIASGAITAGNALKQTLSGGYFAANAMMMMATLMAQLFASVMNIQNVLNNAGIPTGPLNNGSNFNLSGLAGIL